MKIDDKRGMAVVIGVVEHGSVFENGKALYIKTSEVRQAVNLSTGRLALFSEDATLTLLPNAKLVIED